MNDRINVTMQEDAPLTLQTRAALALNSTKTECDLRALAVKNVTIVQVIDKVSRQQCHSAAMELKSARTTIAKVSKDSREDATAFQKAIIAEEKRLIAIVEPEEARLIGLRDYYDEVQERIKREEEARERARITAIHANIAEIRNFLTLAGQCRTSERIKGLMEQLERIQQAEYFVFEEFAGEAETAAVTTFDAMVKLHAAKVQDEEAAAQAKAEAEAAAAALAEQRKAQAAEAAKLAAERAAFEEERRIQRESLAAQEAAFKAQQAAAAAKFEAEARQAREAQERADYAAAIAATPVAPVPAPVSIIREQLERPYDHLAKAWRPTDVEIIDALAERFGVLDVRVLEWLRAMDFDSVAEQIKVTA